MENAPRILIVDDSTAMRSALIRTLRTLEADIDQAENGQLGLDKANMDSNWAPPLMFPRQTRKNSYPTLLKDCLKRLACFISDW